MSDTTEIDTPIKQSAPEADRDRAKHNLALFERLGFEARTERDWDPFRKLHAKVGGFGPEAENVEGRCRNLR